MVIINIAISYYKNGLTKYYLQDYDGAIADFKQINKIKS